LNPIARILQRAKRIASRCMARPEPGLQQPRTADGTVLQAVKPNQNRNKVSIGKD
jgi:hypothetical protein